MLEQNVGIRDGLDLLPEDQFAFLEDLRNVRLQLAGPGIDDLLLFLDPDSQ
jgi:hypothetical protein